LEANKNNQATLVGKRISVEIRNELEKFSGSSRVLFVELNLYDSASLNKILEKTINKFGSSKILLNNAGIGLVE
jgi:NADP-dependent 3-hydroxy acid dehydrogenase YdfG